MYGSHKENIMKRLQALPSEILVAVEDFIDFLAAKQQFAALKVEEPSSTYGSAKKSLTLSVQDFNDFLTAKYAKQTIAPNTKKSKSGYGAAKGLINHIANDFNAPLDDFKDYM